MKQRSAFFSLFLIFVHLIQLLIIEECELDGTSSELDNTP